MTAKLRRLGRTGWIVVVVLASIMAVVAAGLGLLVLEGRRVADRTGEYVALGSSFAAGPQLGPWVPRSPYACWRTQNNYAQQVARRTGLRLVDVSCGGATAKNILEGGPFFTYPQIDAVGPSAKLVTITIGGNDVAYIGDLGLMAWRGRGGVLSSLIRLAWDGPQPPEARPYAELARRLSQIVASIRQRAPGATVVLLTYPQVLPAQGSCPEIGLTEPEVYAMRDVGARLADATRQAAAVSGALILDIAAASEGHDACSADRWVNGASAPSGDGAMFHPNGAGMRATATSLEQLIKALRVRDGR